MSWCFRQARALDWRDVEALFPESTHWYRDPKDTISWTIGGPMHTQHYLRLTDREAKKMGLLGTKTP